MARVLVACDEVKPVPGFPAYLVSNCGGVFSCNHASGLKNSFRELRPSEDKKGYLGLTICSDGKRRKVRIHRLVAELFVPNPDNLPCVRHLDGNPKNNHASNLAWGSYQDNENDKHQHGTWDARRNGKLDAWQVRAARAVAKHGARHEDIARAYGVSRPTITRLINRTTWSNLP